MYVTFNSYILKQTKPRQFIKNYPNETLIYKLLIKDKTNVLFV